MHNESVIVLQANRSLRASSARAPHAARINLRAGVRAAPVVSVYASMTG